ncbi:MAG TPA: N-acetylmuramoyl-L-alanine amidase [Chloroflexota bacterium]
MAEISWVGCHPNNYTVGRYGYQPLAIVLHTMDGSLAGCDSWFNNPQAVVSAHYGVGLGGEIHQYVKLTDMAYANGSLEAGNRWPFSQSVNPNYVSVSIETEDLGDPSTPVSDAMFASVRSLCDSFHGACPTLELVTTHQVISPQSRAGCPGSRWTSGRMQQLGYPVLI